VEVTLVVHDPRRAPRASETLTVPSWADVVAVPVPTDPRFALAGVLMLRLPAVSVNVVVVSPLVAP
jgi:hypothetical protein